MKNLLKYYSLLLVCLLFLSSCNNDDEPEVSPIVGTWSFDDFELKSVTVNGQPLVQFLQFLGASQQEALEAEAEIKEIISATANFENTTLNFRSDGTYEIRVNGVIEESGTYELINGNTLLRLLSEGNVDELQVSRLTTNQLTLLIDEEDSGDFLGIGFPVLVRAQLELNLRK
ncbi:lipocalin family protein [Mongoliitalea lutea]|uniref:Lipocalin-like domain-containing protein n=1 Tax=Mongoliitalea lutea TaxID=849756 RepID=A0A8J3CXT5_9BACT|nr:lipocalin family protein [Mongoliitalea lutea]GHB45704.1 hypothetical protein GCM10008106_28430 [Mongoliitalea lutea]